MTGHIWQEAKPLSSTEWTEIQLLPLSFPSTFHAFIIQQHHIPAESKSALPPGRMNPGRSPAPCAATKIAAGNTRSNKGDSGNILDGRCSCRPESSKLFKIDRKEDIWHQPLFERHRCPSAKRVKRSLLLFRVQPGARCDRPADDSLEESDKVNYSATRHVWKRTKSSNARKGICRGICSHSSTRGPCVKTQNLQTRCQKKKIENSSR